MADRIQTRKPIDCLVRQTALRRFEKMDDRKERGGKENGHHAAQAANQYPEDESSKKQFLNNRDHCACYYYCGHFRPEEMLSKRVHLAGNEDRAATKKRNKRNEKAHDSIGSGVGIPLQAEILGLSNLDRAQERPKE